MESSKDKDIVCLIMHHTHNFKPETLLLKPVVYIHVIDEKTGMYLKKSERNRAVVSCYENQRGDVDYIMPLMTQPCITLRGKKSTLMSWEEEFILNEPYSSFISSESSVILFFEIGDMVTMNSSNISKELQNGIQVVAWSFLKIVGSNNVLNSGSKLCLQLYKPCKPLKNRNPSLVGMYQLWLQGHRNPMDASFYISIKPHAPFTVEPALRSMLPIQQEKGSTTFEGLFTSNNESSSQCAANFKCPALPCDKNTEIIWTRKAGEMCEIPREKKLLLEVIDCCQIVKFSSNGRFLAIGCGAAGSYYLMFYEIPSGKLLHKLLAHSEPIYDIDWTYNDKYLLSASGDCTVKIWFSRLWCHRVTFMHPSYVHCAKFQPFCEDLFASACYDHIIRIYLLEISVFKELESHVSTVCTLCWNTSGTKLYSADGIGQIKVWRKVPQALRTSYQLEKEIKPEETMGISINKMVINTYYMTTHEEETLCLFCSDSIIRVLTLNGKLITSFESLAISPKLSKGCCSPSGNLFFLCSFKGIACFSYKDFYGKYDHDFLYDVNYGVPSCIDYHPYEHMLALSFWENGVPVHVYERPGRVATADDANVQEICKRIDSITIKNVSESSGNIQEICDEINSLVIENDMPQSNDNPKKRSKLENQQPIGTCAGVTSEATSKIYGAAKYRAYNLDKSALSSSMDRCSSTEPKDYKKEFLTVEASKSRPFDGIAVTDDYVCPDSNKFRSSTDSTFINRSSKRSERRRKLRDMNKA